MNNMKPLFSSLLIRDLELRVFLGWPEKERLKEQRVLLNADIRYANPPAGCETDKLEDTVCYAEVIEQVREKIGDKHFHLIEYLSHDIYHIMKPLLPEKALLTIRITKHPMIAGLTGGVQFSFGDEA